MMCDNRLLLAASMSASCSSGGGASSVLRNLSRCASKSALVTPNPIAVAADASDGGLFCPSGCSGVPPCGIGGGGRGGGEGTDLRSMTSLILARSAMSWPQSGRAEGHSSQQRSSKRQMPGSRT